MKGADTTRTGGAPTSTSSQCLLENDEAALLERAKEFDPVALGVIYDRHAPKLHRYLYRRLGDADLAEDLTAQAFLQMLQAIRDDKAWRTSLSGWLYRIAHNLLVDHLRQRSRGERVSLEDAPPLLAPDGDPVAITDSRLAWDRLVASIGRLTDDQAQVVMLRFQEGLSIAEVARVMGKSEGAVKALQYRAVIALRDRLADETDPEIARYGARIDARADVKKLGAWEPSRVAPAVA